MLQTFPDVNTTVQGMSTVWLLSKQSSDFVSNQDFMKLHTQITQVNIYFTVCRLVCQ